MKINNNIKPSNDFIFKRLFSKKGNEDLLINLLKGILNIEIQKEAELETNILSNKLGVLDLKATLNTKEIVDIEIQVKDKKDMIDRTLYYWSGLFYNQLEEGNFYINTNKTITINILLFDIFKDEGPFLERLKIRRDYKNKIATDKLEIYFIQIPKFLKRKEEINKDLKDWLYFILQDEREVKRAMNENPKIKKAQEEYEYLTGDEATKRIAELRQKAIRDEGNAMYHAKEEGIAEGMKKGIQKGKQEGKMESKKEIAKKLLKKGMTIEEVENITELTRQEIEEIKR